MLSTEIIIASFLAIMMLASFVSIRLRAPYTLVLVLFGILLSATSVFSLLGEGPIQNAIQSVISDIRTLYQQSLQGGNGGVFVGLVVPPLIFEAMMHIRSSDLRSVIRPSFFLATVGVVIATLVGGFVLWRVAGLSPYVSFLFAALISPTDAATVLEIFRRAKVPSKLVALMDTEAAFNDATGIVIFTIVLASITLQRVSLVNAAASFIFIFGGGVVIGLIVGFVAELLTSLITDRLAETILTISAVYGSYSLASALNVSGLVAVSIVGLYFGNLTISAAIRPGTREAVTLFWEFAAFLGNSVAFLFIGFQTNILSLVSSIRLILIAFLAVTAARLAVVYPILTVFDRINEKIPLKWRNIAMLGGMRGALSIALAASIVSSAFISEADIGTISDMVLGVAFISLTVQAAILFRYIRHAFPRDVTAEAEGLSFKLAKSVSAIEALQKLKEEGKISDEEFAIQLEKGKDELGDVLAEIKTSLGARNIIKSRAYGLYSSIIKLPTSRAMEVLRRQKMSKPIENMVEKTAELEKKEEVGKEDAERTSDRQAD